MIGNPGTGKSSTINCLVGKQLFHSGVSSCGTGVTYELDIQEHDNVQYMDTPGLADVNLRKDAAAAIEKALRIGGNFQVIFMMVLDDNRIREDDLCTMKIVLQAANQLPPEGYAIMFNKNKPKSLRKLDKEKFLANLNKALTERGVSPTKFVHFAACNEDLEGEDDALVDLPLDTQSFLQDVPVLNIDGNKVTRVNAESFDDIKNAMAEEQGHRRQAEAARANAEKREKDAQEQQRREQVARENAERAHKQARIEAARLEELRNKAEKEREDSVEEKKLVEKLLEQERRAAEEEAAQAEAERQRKEAENEARLQQMRAEQAERDRQATLAMEKALDELKKEAEDAQQVAQQRADDETKKQKAEHEERLQQMQAAQEKAIQRANEEAKKHQRQMKYGEMYYIRDHEGYEYYIDDAGYFKKKANRSDRGGSFEDYGGGIMVRHGKYEGKYVYASADNGYICGYNASPFQVNWSDGGYMKFCDIQVDIYTDGYYYSSNRWHTTRRYKFSKAYLKNEA